VAVQIVRLGLGDPASSGSATRVVWGPIETTDVAPSAANDAADPSEHDEIASGSSSAERAASCRARRSGAGSSMAPPRAFGGRKSTPAGRGNRQEAVLRRDPRDERLEPSSRNVRPFLTDRRDLRQLPASAPNDWRRRSGS
jgi:hypothetical protein